MERKYAIAQDEIKRRQQAIDRLEAELLREKKSKHIDHICENCNQPCIKSPDMFSSQMFDFKKLNNKVHIPILEATGRYVTPKHKDNQIA